MIAFSAKRRESVRADSTVQLSECEIRSVAGGFSVTDVFARPLAFLDASESGGDVFFLTTAQLSTRDFDNSYDVYDAHECTPESPCAPQPAAAPGPCTTAEACRAAPEPPPSVYAAPSSATFSGLGNLTPPPAAKPAVKVKTLTRAQKLSKALAACRRDRKKAKRRTCEKQAKQKYGAVKTKKAKKKAGGRVGK